ncbi:MAG: helix-turn-helix domain-containing protein [Geminicoccaceae bacterium]
MAAQLLGVSVSEFPRLVISNADLTASSEVAAASDSRRSPGMRPLIRHFITVSDLKPAASAKARTFGQTESENTSSMAKLSDDMSGLSRTAFTVTPFPSVRSFSMSEKAYRSGLADRMRTARIHRGVTQEQIGEWLSIGREAYRKHETRGSLPPHLFEQFAALTGLDVLYLLTGRKQAARGPRQQPATPISKKRSA